MASLAGLPGGGKASAPAKAGRSGGAPVAPPSVPHAAPVQVPHSTPAPAHAAAPHGGGGPLAALGSTGALSGKQLYGAAAALASAKYDPSLKQLASEIAQQNAQTANATKLSTGYFNGVNALAAKNTAQEGQIASGLNSQLSGMGAGLQSQLQSIGQNGLDVTQAYAPQGTTIAADSGATSQLASAIAEQKGLAAQQSANLEGVGALQGANFQGLASAVQPAYAELGRQEVTKLGQANAAKVQPLNQKVGTLEGERQVDLVNNLTALRNQEIKNQYDNATLAQRAQATATTAGYDRGRLGIAQQAANNTAAKNQTDAAYKANVLQATDKALGIKQQAANVSAAKTQGELAYQRAQAATNAARVKVERLNAQTAAQRVGLTAKYDEAKTKQGWASLADKQQATLSLNAYRQGELNLKRAQTGVGAKPLTTLQNNTMTLLLNEAAGYIKGEQGRATRQQINRALTTGVYSYPKSAIGPTGQPEGVTHALKTAVDPVLIQAAHQLIDNGAITPQTAKALQQMGMRGTRFNGAPLRVQNPARTRAIATGLANAFPRSGG